MQPTSTNALPPCLTRLLLAGLLALLASSAGAESVWIFFPSFDLAAFEGFTSEDFEDEAVPTLDVFYGFHNDRWQALVEVVLSSNERELERLQVGRRLGDGRRLLWLGRYHTPVGIWTWNTTTASFSRHRSPARRSSTSKTMQGPCPLMLRACSSRAQPAAVVAQPGAGRCLPASGRPSTASSSR